MKKLLKTLGIATILASATTNISAQEVADKSEKVGFFKQAFRDMKRSAKQQREIDKANFKAQKMETKAFYEEQKALSNPKARKTMAQSDYLRQMAEAKARQNAAEQRINKAKESR